MRLLNKIILAIIFVGVFLLRAPSAYACVTGGSGGTGGTGGAAGSTASAGTAGTSDCEGGGGGGGGGGGSGSGGGGGNGAGGGILIASYSSTTTISGTIDNRGGGSSTSNGGTVKIFYTGSAPSTAGVQTGRLYTATTPANTVISPVLLSPQSGAIGISTSPLFQLRSIDPENDYLQYKILVYNSDCSTGLQTFDQTASQVGWSGQDKISGTAYTGYSSITGSTIASYGLANLSANTQYCWKAASIDPGGSNTWSSYSATQLFTTSSANSSPVNIKGGATIQGGALIR